jgi:hypothetical protein
VEVCSHNSTNEVRYDSALKIDRNVFAPFLFFAISKSGAMDCNKILQEIYMRVKSTSPDGRVNDYIPELAQVDPGKFGIALITVKGENLHCWRCG